MLDVWIENLQFPTIVKEGSPFIFTWDCCFRGAFKKHTIYSKIEWNSGEYEEVYIKRACHCCKKKIETEAFIENGIPEGTTDFKITVGWRD